MPEQYVTKWQHIWQRWAEFEQEWNGDHRKSLLNSLMTSADSNRKAFLAAYGKKKLPQPTPTEIDELWQMGTVVQSLDKISNPLPDVYATACQMKVQQFSCENVSTSRTYGFRGQRNHCWPLISSIQRDLPGNDEQKIIEMEKRVRILALFSEALQRAFSEIEPTELECVAIAQHYGVASPLCDFTWSPWVGLFFASDGGLTGDVGIVQCFSISRLAELTGHGKSLFGNVRIVEVKYVPRITAQQGFFIELPGHRLDKQIIPFSFTFEQHDGLVFEDEHLSITRSRIYPSAAEDQFAAFARPTLQTYPFIPLHRPFTGADYFLEAKEWYPKQFSQGGKDVESLGRELCEFHCRLQAAPSLRDYERSITRLRTALSLIFSSLDQGCLCAMTDLVEYYVSQASDESQKAIMQVWKTMNVSHTD